MAFKEFNGQTYDFSPYVLLHEEFFKTNREKAQAGQPISEAEFLSDCRCASCRTFRNELGAAGLADRHDDGGCRPLQMAEICVPDPRRRRGRSNLLNHR